MLWSTKEYWGSLSIQFSLAKLTVYSSKITKATFEIESFGKSMLVIYRPPLLTRMFNYAKSVIKAGSHALTFKAI